MDPIKFYAGFIIAFAATIFVGSIIGRVIRKRDELPSDLCVCTHSLEWHTHHRDGSDCSSCGCRVYTFYMTLAESQSEKEKDPDT